MTGIAFIAIGATYAALSDGDTLGARLGAWIVLIGVAVGMWEVVGW